MVSNPARRTALADAAIEILAAEGARGLTFRTVDGRAGVPRGTTTNYFASWDALLEAAGHRIYERLRPEPVAPPAADRDTLVDLLQAIVDRAVQHRDEHLALLELRLEATRRPEVHAALAGIIGGNLEEDLEFHRRSGLPGDRHTIGLLVLALNGLILELLTVPVATEVTGTEGVVRDLVERMLG